ncbi:TetR/AcrR family transcriptional regulator [Bacillus marasmi]|uniref:TetR/AcrR family transcriptional regulator n=1 Tax=Bacillus marasmi TaxID=1926279 RepID=UPI0011C81DDC|nr:TetR/AcrR family transcriptional regulator [Bacillus marasmi]
MEKKTDLRVLRTKKLIKEAFLSLIDKKGFESITIQDIADLAFINRATFYLHYQDKYDLLDQICDSYILELISTIKNPFHLIDDGIDIKQIQITLLNVFENIEKNIDFYKIMMGPNGNADFANKVESFLFEKFTANFITVVGDLNKLEISADFLLKYLCSAYIGVIRWWVLKDNRHSTQYMAEHLTQIVTKGPLSMIGPRIE